MARCLLLVDPQCDFIDGALPVPGAKSAMHGLATTLRAGGPKYALKIVTCDFHPWNHCSFQENGGTWPRHCVAYSQGAAIWPELLAPLHNCQGNALVLPKGTASGQEEYSIFQNPASKTLLLKAIETAGIDSIDICGLAGDVCVLHTLKGGIQHGDNIDFTVLEAFTPSLDGGTALADFCAQEGICVK